MLEFEFFKLVSFFPMGKVHCCFIVGSAASPIPLHKERPKQKMTKNAT